MNRAERRQQEKLAKKAAKKGGAPAAQPQVPASGNQLNELLGKAVEFHGAGQLDEAVPLYKKILEVDPNQPDANHLLGVIAHSQNDLTQAEQLISKALSVHPNFPEALNNYAIVISALGRAAEAPDHLKKAISLNPDYLEPYFHLGLACTELGRLEDAIAAYEDLLKKDPDNVKALNNCGNLYQELGRLDDAVRLQQRNVELDPDSAIPHSNLGAIYMQQKRFEDATAEFAAAIACDPMFTDGLNNMGCALIELERFDEAVSMFNTAISLNPEAPSAYSSLSDVLILQHKYAEAEEALTKALTLQNDFADAHMNMGILKLTQGDWANGWKHYSWRRAGKSESLQARNYPRPLWNGEPFEGKTLFIYPEQGGGDFLQFVRFVRLAAERGGKVILEVPLPFAGLPIDVPDNVEIVSSSDMEIQIDLHASIMDLPWMLGFETEDQLAAEPYVHVPDNIKAQWAERLGEKVDMRVGLVWSGNPDHRNDKNRSIDASMLSSLSDIEGVSFYSFQVGPTADQYTAIGQGVTDLSPHFSDYVQTAGALSQIDLLISVDTSVVHLAGAMGIPAWVLIPKVPDWRWMLDRADNPWYLRTRVYRQADFGAWEPVFEKVKADLEKTAS